MDGQSEIKEYKQGDAELTKPLPEADADQKAASKAYSEAGTILKELSKPAEFEIAGSDNTIGGVANPAYGKTTNDIPAGKDAPLSKQNKIPSAK